MKQMEPEEIFSSSLRGVIVVQAVCSGLLGNLGMLRIGDTGILLRKKIREVFASNCLYTYGSYMLSPSH